MFLYNYDSVDMMAFNIKQVQKLIIIVLMWVSLPLFILLTNPENLPIPLLVVPFLLLYATLYMSARLSMKYLVPNLTKGRTRLIATLIASLPTLLLVLASIKQLTIRDTAIVVGLLVFLVFYLRRMDFLKI